MKLCNHCNKRQKSETLVPEPYYRYATPWEIEEMWDCIALRKMTYTTEAGTMTVSRFGIIERSGNPCSDASADGDKP